MDRFGSVVKVIESYMYSHSMILFRFSHCYYYFQFALLSLGSASEFPDSLLNFAVLEFLLSIRDSFGSELAHYLHGNFLDRT